MPAILLLLQQFWKPLAFGIVILSILGGLRYYGYTEYKRGYKEMQVKYQVCQDNFAVESKKWQEEVRKQKESLKAFEEKKTQTIERNWDVFKETKKKVVLNKKETDNEIKATIRPSDVVLTPLAFVSVYNHAVEGSRASLSNKGEAKVSGNSGGVESKGVSFDATYFTQVVKGNVDEYNLLANRCNTLIDIVEELEKDYGDNIAGPNVPPRTDGGNLPSGTVGPASS
jgi:hypothetical protein